MEKEMEKNVIIEDIIFHSDVDYFNYYSNLNALNLLYNSILISICAFFETRIEFLCKLLEKSRSTSIKSIGGKSNIEKFKNYLSEVHSVDFEPVNKEWEQIIAYAYLRNKLVHNQFPNIKIKSNQEGYSRLKKIRYLSITINNGVATFKINDPKLLDEYISDVYKFLHFTCYKKNNELRIESHQYPFHLKIPRKTQVKEIRPPANAGGLLKPCEDGSGDLKFSTFIDEDFL